MINLLPPETKDMYRYARRNRKLVQWVSACLLSVLGAAVLAGGGYLYLNRSVQNDQDQVAAAQHDLAAQDLSGVQKQVTTMSNNLKLVNQVLSKEILFSSLLKRLGSVTPPNVILTNLSIPQTQGGVDITAQTSDYQAATQLQINLSDPHNQIFSKADIIGITCNNGQANPQYPCNTTIRALFAKNNPFLFINSDKASS